MSPPHGRFGDAVREASDRDPQAHPRQATMTLVWTVENQDAVGKWFRVTPKLFENRFDAIECV